MASKKKVEKASYKETLAWAERLIADGIIREGFGSLKSSLYSVLHTFRVCEKEGWQEYENH